MVLPPTTAKELDASMATVVVVVACASAAAFALHSALRLLLRRLRERRASNKPGEEEPEAAAPPAPQLLPGSVVFAAGATAVAGTMECAICLAELAEGERVRVMPACGHAFHAHCVDSWLVARSSSCPTCRSEWSPADEEAAPSAAEP